MKTLLPLLLLLIGLGAGAGGGIALRPAAAPPPAEAHAPPPEGGEHGTDTLYRPDAGSTETVRLPNQFVVPVIENGRVQAMVVIGLALELSEGHGFSLASDEPRLRATFLQLLFDHANIGGFDGLFTSGEALLALRRTLVEAGRAALGPAVQDVLITELLRQES